MGIRGKLALLVSGLVALTVIGVALGVTRVQRQELATEFRRRHELLLESVGVTAAVYVAQNDMAGLDALVAQVSQERLDPDLLELSVVSVEGRIIAHSDPTRFNEEVTDPFTRRALQSEDPLWAREGHTLRIAVPARAGIRWATISATYSLSRLEDAVTRTRTTWFFGAALLGLGVCLLILTGLYRMVVRPVRTLQRAARQMGEGVLDARVPHLGRGELGELGETFNKMAEALQSQQAHLERTVEERTRALREANERLETLAVTDGLTGVFNHRRFQETLAQEAQRSARTGAIFCVLMVDVDHFKRFNDTFGHPVGDVLLRDLAQVLKARLRGTDFIARYGGEEFGIILPDTDRDGGLQMAERLRAAVEGEVNPKERELRITISVGVAAFGVDGTLPHEVLIAADKALYEAKRAGRNRVVAAGASPERTTA